MAFPQMARFFAMYYGAFAILRYRKFIDSPVKSLNRLSANVLKTTMAISGAIGASWGSICLFAAILPRTFLPKFRFFLGGLLGGMFQFFDRGSSGRTNSLYAARVSAGSLWKVGIKHGWWKGFQGGDVWVFATALALLNIIFESKEGAVDSGMVKWGMKVLRGEADIGLAKKVEEREEMTESA